MDQIRFDRLTRVLAQGTSRRRLLSGLAGAVAAAATAASQSATAATCPPGQYLASGTRCLCKATGRPPGPTGCPCGPGQSTCGGACITANTCCIDGIAIPAGTLDPSSECRACQPWVSTTAWTDRAAGESCGEAGRCGGACDGARSCVVSPPVATAGDCGGRCYSELDARCLNTVTICGQEVQCPSCTDWAAQGCFTHTHIAYDGPLGSTCYFLGRDTDSSCTRHNECAPWGFCLGTRTGYPINFCVPICPGD